MSDENDKHWFKQLLKTIGMLIAILIGLVIVGFGLLVGVCGLLFR